MKDTQELERLYEEVQRAAKSDFGKGQAVKDFYGKLADFIGFIESKKSFTKYIAKLRDDKIIKKIDSDLINEGEQILQKIRGIHPHIKSTVADSGIVLPDLDEAQKSRKPGVFYDISPTESLAMNLRNLDRQLAKENHDVTDIPRIKSTLSVTVLDLGYLKVANLYSLPEIQELDKMEERYQGLLDRKRRRINLLRLSDYDELLQVHDALDSEPQSEHGLGFKFKESYRYAQASSNWLPVSDKQKIEKERDVYMENVTRVYELIKQLGGGWQKFRKQFLDMDELMSSNTISSALQWLWRLLSGVVGYLLAHLPPIHF